MNAVAGQNTAVSFELVARASPAPALAVTTAAVTAAVSVSATPRETDRASTSSFWKARRVTSAIVLGAAAVGAGAAVVFGLESGSAASHASDVRTQLGSSTSCAQPIPAANQVPCSDLRNSVNREVIFHNASTGLYVGAGVLAVGAALTYTLWPSKGDSKQGVILPVVDPVSKTGGVVGRLVF